MIILGTVGITLVSLMVLEDKGRLNVNPWLLKTFMYTLFFSGAIYCVWKMGSTLYLF